MQEIFEKIKERLEEKISEAIGWNHHKVNALRGAIEIINQVAEEYVPDINVRNNDGWIPCSSGKMPEDCVDVLVWFEYFRYGEYNRLFQMQGIGYAYNGEWSGFVNNASGWHQLSIIAWQPLPAPYKPKGESNGK